MFFFWLRFDSWGEIGTIIVVDASMLRFGEIKSSDAVHIGTQLKKVGKGQFTGIS